MKKCEVLIATKNEGKVREFIQIFDEIGIGGGIVVKSLLDFGDTPKIEETGRTFSENALIKARAVARMERIRGSVVIADDSGVEVEALGGRPGVNSARYAGPNATDEENNEKLLRELSGVAEGERGASFTIAIAIVGRGGKEGVVMGRCPGVIITVPRGKGGFGYDPIFFYPPLNKTFSEMDDSEKNGISHRRIGIERLAEILPDYL
ncbi:MAG: RdgB/HAM1 family non-canonical purine NTP pyrophosphatase [Deltaproteobacteria bacterium]|uniref:dITP/XTP pyrophosphatase n=1 Tax=Candidatus Zymogenus saltonus TaxID=2844893 RepID=A0A9D8KIC9_9DELT|nr:RdgB/HAM1 family non-canonical purine NTP pyrophosphatase [Candidatus Zymogenus saltonus]